MLAADYSQIELRLLAHFAEDEKLVAAFQSDQDVHRRAQQRRFFLAPAGSQRRVRARAKAVNFGIIYGIGVWWARGLVFSRKEAEAFIDAYFSRYQG